MENTMKIKAGDVVKHEPTGETWVVCGVDYKSGGLIPCGYPFPTLGRISDCALVRQGSGQSKEMKNALRDHHLFSFIEEAAP